MCDEIPQTSKRMNRIESEAADQFDATILHNRVYEALGQAGRIRQLVDVAERAYQLEEYSSGYSRDVRQAAFGAAEDLNDKIEDVVEERIAVECATVIKDARTDWFDDHAADEDVEEAFQEACTWLVEHRDAACGADLDVDALVWNESDDGQEVAADV